MYENKSIDYLKFTTDISKMLWELCIYLGCWNMSIIFQSTFQYVLSLNFK